MMTADWSDWHNVTNPVDVDQNNRIGALDALIVINQISHQGRDSLHLAEQGGVSQSLKVDVNNDSMLTAMDALLVVNQLESNLGSASGIAPSITSLERLPSDAGAFHFLLHGNATSGSVVEIHQNGTSLVGQTLADAQGAWQITLTDASLLESKFQYTAVELDAAGVPVGESESISHQPNIVLVNTDDMRYEQTRFMPFLEQLQQQSTVFESAYVPTSVSGPSRASLMSGLFAAGHGYLNNSLTLGTSINEDRTTGLPVWLSEAGYRTGLFGKDRTQPKVEDRFESQDILQSSPGWDDYFAGVSRGNNGYNVGFSDNGVLVEPGPDSHLTDVIRDETIQFIEQTPSDVPFFAYVAPNAPHSPGIPTLRHSGTYSDVELPQAPSVQIDESLEDGFLDMITQQYRGGSEALLDVDEAIQSVYDYLVETAKLDNTVIIFTSDNGRGVGEHGIFYKNKFWEESIQVPLLVFDGRAPVGQTTDALAALPDLTSTLLDLGGATATQPIEGQSLLPVLSSPNESVREDFLIQQVYDYNFETQLQWEFGVHTGSHVYVETLFPIGGQSRFLFDLDADPFQLSNLVDDPSSQGLLSELDMRLEELRGPDRQSPALSSVQWEVSGTQYDEPQTLRLIANVSDVESGNSEIRTPALTYERWSNFSVGIPLEAQDGLFNDSVESTTVELELADMAEAETPGVLYLTTRDVIGNIGNPIRLRAPVDDPPTLEAESDTGESDSDRITLDSTPTFSGTGTPGERVALFTPDGPETPDRLLGTAVVDQGGGWEITAPFDQPGETVVYAQIGAPIEANEPSFRFTAPLRFHLVATTQDEQVSVLGTKNGDAIVVTELSLDQWQIQINGVDAGTVPAAARLTINGSVGDDYLKVVGDIRSRLLGSSGDDQLIGGSNTDILIGGRGRNELSGGLGNDIYQFSWSDKILESELITPGLRDVIKEQPGEGVDRVRFIGSVEVNADFDTHATDPQIVVQPDFDYERVIRIEYPRELERIEGPERDSQFRIGATQTFIGGSGDDSIGLIDLVEQDQIVDLGVLQSGGELDDLIDMTLTAASGTLTVSGEDISDSLEVTIDSATSIRVSGLRQDVNDALKLRHIELLTADSFVGNVNVVAATTLQSQVAQSDLSQTPQIDHFSFEVAPLISFSGVTDDVQSEDGRNLRLFPKIRIAQGDQNYRGAVLRLESTFDVQPRDALLLLGQVPGPNSITVTGADIFYGGIEIGVLMPRESISQPLEIVLSENASRTAVEKLVRRLAFRHLSSDPTTETRRIRMSLETLAGEQLVANARVQVERSAAIATPSIEFSGGDSLVYRTQTPRFIGLGGGNRVLSDEDLRLDQLTVELVTPVVEGSELRLLSGAIRSLQPVTIDPHSRIISVDGTYVGNLQSQTDHRVVIHLSRFAKDEDMSSILRRFQYRNELADTTSPDQIVRIKLDDLEGLVSTEVDRVIRFE